MPGCEATARFLPFPMRIRAAGETDVGRVRARNEDALLQRPARGFVAVADGMGGHAAGDIASRIAVDVLDERTAHLPDSGRPEYIRESVLAAHQAILKAADADTSLEGMGTTVTALFVDPDMEPARCILVHVGDSRAYRLRAGALEQLTRDQTWVQDQIDAGALSPEQARGHPYSSVITSALGIRNAPVDVQLLAPDCAPGDLFLLCSDGLIARLEDDELRSILVAHHDLHRAARALVDAANEAGGPDNITVALVQLEDHD